MNQDIPEWTTDDFRQSRRVRDIPELAALAAAADRPCRYAVYPQELALRTRDSVNEYVSLEKALGRASERARAGENVLVTASEDDFVTFKTIARINAVPTEDLL